MNEQVYSDIIYYDNIDIGELYIIPSNRNEICLCLGITGKRQYARFYSLREKETFLINVSKIKYFKNSETIVKFDHCNLYRSY